MNKDDREFLDYLNNRQREGRNSENCWFISSAEFERGLALGKRDWHRVGLNGYHFKGVNLHGFSFNNADLDNCHFEDCDLRYTRFSHSVMRDTRFMNCDMEGAGLFNVDLRWSTFVNCNLEAVDLERSQIRLVRGVKIVSPVGRGGRLLYAYVHEGKTRIQAGCRNDVPAAVKAAVLHDYEAGSMYQADYLDAIKLLESWGKREAKRLKALVKGA